MKSSTPPASFKVAKRGAVLLYPGVEEVGGPSRTVLIIPRPKGFRPTHQTRQVT